MPTVTLSKYHPSVKGFLTRTVEVDDTPRPAGRVFLNGRSIWIKRYVRTFYAVSTTPPGAWIPIDTPHAITPSRRRLVARFIGQLTAPKGER